MCLASSSEQGRKWDDNRILSRSAMIAGLPLCPCYGPSTGIDVDQRAFCWTADEKPHVIEVGQRSSLHDPTGQRSTLCSTLVAARNFGRAWRRRRMSCVRVTELLPENKEDVWSILQVLFEQISDGMLWIKACWKKGVSSDVLLLKSSARNFCDPCSRLGNIM